jgi:hypothetical protein
MDNAKRLTWPEFLEQFRPTRNELSNESDQLMYETYGAELEFVMNADPNHVWTYVDSGEYAVTVEGRQIANRVGYFITELPWVEGTSYEVDLDEVPESCSGCGEEETPDGETLMVSYGCDSRKEYCMNCCNCADHRGTEWY